MIAHLIEIGDTAWSVSHPAWCGDVLACEVTQVCRAYTSAPKTGRYWASACTVRGRAVMELGAVVPPEIQGNSRKTSGSYAVAGQQPGHPAFGSRERLMG